MSNLPRIAIYYESRYRNDGCPLYWYHNLKELEREGKIGEVVHLIPTGDLSDYGKFDLNLWVDWGEDALKDFLPYPLEVPKGAPLAYVASDTHLGKKYRFDMAKQADFVFLNQKRAFTEYKKSKKNKSVEWMPHAAEHTVYRPGVWERDANKWIDAVPNKKFDVCFIGHLQWQKNYNGFTRVEFLDHMFKAFPNFYFGMRQPELAPWYNVFEDTAMKFNQSKIVLNVTIVDDPNMRLFEALACKSFVLMNRVPSLEDIVEDGKHVVLFDTLDEAVEKAQYYLEHDAEREAIAQAGYDLFIKNHTYRQRVEHVLGVAGLLQS